MDWDELDEHKFELEAAAIGYLLGSMRMGIRASAAASSVGQRLVRRARRHRRFRNLVWPDGFESMLKGIDLTSPPGLALMRMCESVLRTPDDQTQTALIVEQLLSADWSSLRGGASIAILKAAAQAAPRALATDSLRGFTKGAILALIRSMAGNFVMGETIEAALGRSRNEGLLCSFDMLGEGARTSEDAARYFDDYARAIAAVGAAETRGPLFGHGVSVKLSALHPRYEPLKEDRALGELFSRLEDLAVRAAEANVSFCIDAEESDRLVISLQLFERLAQSRKLPREWMGLGLAVQAYQKRAPHVLAKLIDLAKASQRRLMIRLVKGAYWDGEIKRGQVGGFPDFSVYTLKEATDVSYLACADKLIAAGSIIYPQFATHNAHTIAAISHIAEKHRANVEFQRLHGMGAPVYAAARREWRNLLVRVYAPVGRHEDLLPYLVRRLLENGASTSFLKGLRDNKAPAGRIVADPVAQLKARKQTRHPKLPVPRVIFPDRLNSFGIDLSQSTVRQSIIDAIGSLTTTPPEKIADSNPGRLVRSPADHSLAVGHAVQADASSVDAAFGRTVAGYRDWNALGGSKRAALLERVAEGLERKAHTLIAHLIVEAGKTASDAVSEVREACDFCRYYASLARSELTSSTALIGPAGERNELSLQGRGVIVCISPWNFPLAIFAGQVAAALAAGCTVVAKPAEQTPLIAELAVGVFRESGISADALQLVQGDGEVGALLVRDPRHAGVAFTGSTDTAQQIAVSIAQRRAAIAPLVAETGGINAIFADASALPEHLVDDAVVSAFGSAGQRCSSARILVIHSAIADRVVGLLAGAMDELYVGDPRDLSVDVGPIIDGDALSRLHAHASHLNQGGKIIKQIKVDDAVASKGTYFGPILAELRTVDELTTEVFGPILHVVRYSGDEYKAIAQSLASKQFGLTLGIHSRLRGFQDEIRTLVPSGNVYINRSIIGAVVGVQPFGGIGRSGTGPKAGGPHALTRFVTERTLTVNVFAEGGDPALLSL